ncbi:transcription factor BTF34 [Hordeum vulgare]|nr:transcription factor BTF34 [Hordeum vulgare]
MSCSASGLADGEGMSYKGAGVDIDAGTELVCRIRKLAPGIGFGGLYPHSGGEQCTTSPPPLGPLPPPQALAGQIYEADDSRAAAGRRPDPALRPRRQPPRAAKHRFEPVAWSTPASLFLLHLPTSATMASPPTAAALRHPGVHVGHVPLPRHAGVPYPCSALKFRLGKLPSRKSRAAVSTTRSPGLGNAGNLREKKAVHKMATTDDKRLQSMLKRVGVNTIPAIEEVNIFKDDLVIQFLNPKALKKHQHGSKICLFVLGPDNMEHLKRIAEEMQKQVAVARAMQTKEEND